MRVVFLFVFIGLIIYGCRPEVKPIKNPVQKKQPQFISHWEDTFTAKEKKKLLKWMSHYYKGTQQTLGYYPFIIHIYYHRSESQSAVPFGFTKRKKGLQTVHFHVNPEANYTEFIEDWVAPHELSHLSVPFLGKENKWFSEGYATYLSRQTQVEMGIITSEEFQEMYIRKINAAKLYYSDSIKTFPQISKELEQNHNYSSMYWGSASYFYIIDQQLKAEKGMRLIEVIQQYQICCRIQNKGIQEVLQSFDAIIAENWFTSLWDSYQKNPCYMLMDRIPAEQKKH